MLFDDTMTAPPGGRRSPTIRGPAPAPIIPGTRLGRYEIDGVIGEGGMGVVFRAHDPALERPLAIKVLHAHVTGARAQVRLLDEARAMAKLRHPAVVPVFDVGRIGSQIHVVMPLVSGGTLHDWLLVSKRDWRDVVARFVTAGRGLAAAHAVGIVHRDFKPANVLLDDDGNVMVGDFGLAARVEGPPVDAANSCASTLAGTPAYMAPEQARGEIVDARADQFSFCVSLWEGVFGERPQKSATQTQPRRFAGLALIAPRGGTSAAPEWLREAIVRGLSTDPAQRWPSLTALLDHIEDELRRTPMNEPAGTRRPWRWLAANAAAAVVVTGAVVLASMPHGTATTRTAPVEPPRAAPLPVAAEIPAVDAPPIRAPSTNREASSVRRSRNSEPRPKPDLSRSRY